MINCEDIELTDIIRSRH